MVQDWSKRLRHIDRVEELARFCVEEDAHPTTDQATLVARYSAELLLFLTETPEYWELPAFQAEAIKKLDKICALCEVKSIIYREKINQRPTPVLYLFERFLRENSHDVGEDDFAANTATGLRNFLFEDIKTIAGRLTASLNLKNESKLESRSLAPIFEAQLNRQALADALNAVMAHEGLSEQKVADRTSFSKTDVNRARNGKASIDKTSSILVELGYPPSVTIPS